MLSIRFIIKVEVLCRNDIRFMYLSDKITSTHMTICNFMNEYQIDTIENISIIFNDINNHFLIESKKFLYDKNFYNTERLELYCTFFIKSN